MVYVRFSREEIISVIPHRPPFLLIDSIQEVRFKKRGVGIKAIGPSDDFIEGYRADRRVMPRTLFVEALAQTAAFVVAGEKLLPGAEREKYPTIGYLVRVGDFTFSGDAKEGDTLRLEVELISSLGNIFKFRGAVEVGGKEICTGDLTFSVY